MTIFKLLAELGIQILKTINKPQAEKWEKEIIELKQKRRDEENKPSIEDRENFPELKDRDFRNNAILDELDNKLFDLCQAILTTSREK